jgi:hypothetical protein
MKTKISILFYVKRAKANSEGLFPIYLRVTIEGKRIETSVQRYVEAGKWSSEAGRVKGSSEDVRTINKHLDQLKQTIYDHETDLRSEKREVNYENMKNKILGVEVKSRMLIPIFQKHNSDVKALLGKEFAPGTLERYTISLSTRLIL